MNKKKLMLLTALTLSGASAANAATPAAAKSALSKPHAAATHQVKHQAQAAPHRTAVVKAKTSKKG